MASELVPVTPSVLRWAREHVGVSVEEAAKRATVSVERLEAWESGEAEPTLAKLRQLGKLYQRPISVFLLPEPPRRFDTLRDFRKLPGVEDHTWSRPLHKVFRRAVDQQSSALEILEELGEEPPQGRVPSVRLATPPEEAGGIARLSLEVDLQTQFSWRKPEEAFTGWLQAVEASGAYVLRTSDVDPDEMRGFSIPGPVPVIVVNALDWPRGQVFTLLHEFAHLMLREGGLCDLLEPDSYEARQIETWCNAVASATLMPAEPFLKEAAPLALEDVPADWEQAFEGGWDDAALHQLSQRWGVSQEAVVRRLVTLGQATNDFYRIKREQYREAYVHAREDEKARRRTSKGGPPPHRMTIRDRGKPYVRLVLDAYNRDVLTPSSTSNLLSLKLKHLVALEHEIGA
jgi:Zn-dependent peptidase ImmA (M78 family)/DNA-binding XRE family transcriptional regulator